MKEYSLAEPTDKSKEIDVAAMLADRMVTIWVDAMDWKWVDMMEMNWGRPRAAAKDREWVTRWVRSTAQW